MPIYFEFLPHAGEAVVVQIDDYRLLIDGGCSHPFNNAYDQTTSMEAINAILVTHIDKDHIEGVIQLLEEDSEKLDSLETIIFNEPYTSNLFSANKTGLCSIGQGIKLAKLLMYRNKKSIYHVNDVCIDGCNLIILRPNINLKIISPTQETLNILHKKWNWKDYTNESSLKNNITQTEDEFAEIEFLAKKRLEKDTSLPNKSSIVFILTVNNSKFLFMGDGHIDETINGLKSHGYNENNPLIVDFVKLSHHGSKKNISAEFLSIIKSNIYIICQAYENQSKHPDRETIAKIAKFAQPKNISDKIRIYLTKDKPKHLNFDKKTQEKYNFSIQVIEEYYIQHENL